MANTGEHRCYVFGQGSLGRNRFIPRLTVLCLLVGIASIASAKPRMYVDLNATGASDGTSWEDAFTSIGAAIEGARYPTDIVWIADGTYFEAIRPYSSMQLYGGFTGVGGLDETELEQRDPVQNVTVIDGSTSNRQSLAEMHYAESNEVSDLRAQVIYNAGEVGPARTLTSLSLDAMVDVAQVERFTVRMKHTLQSTFHENAAWQNTGWTIVYQGPLSILEPGRQTFSFAAPFDYNGHDNLMIDYCFDDSLSEGSSFFAAISTNSKRMYFGIDYGPSGDPLTWDEYDTDAWTQVMIPMIQLNGEQISPESGPAAHVVEIGFAYEARLDGFTITGGSAAGHFRGGRGGGLIIDAIGAPSVVANCTFVGNFANGSGGAVSAEWDGDALVFENCTFAFNSADYGGGVSNDSNNTVFTNCRFEGNTASRGGGLACDYGSSATVAYCQFFENHAGQGGGLGDSSEGTLYVRCVFAGNQATWAGGGVMAYSDGAIFEDCILTGNSAQSGGGAYCDSYTSFGESSFIGNSAVYGGGVYCEANGATDFTNCIFLGNLGEIGGGIDAEEGGSFTNCTIADNVAEIAGGLVTGGWTNLRNVLFARNNNHSIREWSNGEPKLINCLFHGNPDGDYYDFDTNATYTGAAAIETGVSNYYAPAGTGDGDPAFVAGPSGTWTESPTFDPVTYQSTLTDTSALFAPDALEGMAVNMNTSQALQCAIASNTATSIAVWGDVTDFVAAGDAYEVKDYHIGAGSAAIDAGDSHSDSPEIVIPADDLDGDTRPQGAEIDIGADEYVFVDTDGDGLLDFTEFVWGLDPTRMDTDGDGLNDYEEVAYDGDATTYNLYDPLNNPTGTDLNAANPDMDGDGVYDGTEVANATSPFDPSSHPLLASVYVDFGYVGQSAGTSEQPVRTLAEARAMLLPSGAMRFLTASGINDTAEVIRIETHMRLENHGALPVRIGVEGESSPGAGAIELLLGLFRSVLASSSRL